MFLRGGVLYQEYCFERENSLSSLPNSLSHGKKRREFVLAHNHRLRGTHQVLIRVATCKSLDSPEKWNRDNRNLSKNCAEIACEDKFLLRSRRPATGVSRALRARVSRGVSRKVFPELESVQKVSRECHFLDTGARGPKGPADTLWDTPSETPAFGDTPQDTRARRARETPVAGRRERKIWKTDFYTVVVLILCKILLQNFQPQRQWCIKILLP